MGLDQVIGKNIKAFREHLNYTQQEISDYLGISQPAYVKYEKGETVVPLEAMEKLATLYNVDEYDLMEENEQLFRHLWPVRIVRREILEILVRFLNFRK